MEKADMILSRVREPGVERHRKQITATDLEDMAALCHFRISEREACAYLSINYPAWLNWKTKHKHNEKWQTLLEKLRCSRLAGAFKHIQNAQKDDWRAADAILKLVSPERYRDVQNIDVTVAPVFNMEAFMRAAAKVYGPPAKPALAATAQPLQIIGPQPEQIMDRTEKPARAASPEAVAEWR
jgi:hypothetical protein